ncbi:MAG TPA: phosphopantetheine-binding protein [Xanthobacteraceae bacterium]|jgi:acyl carrier protein
MPVSALGQTHRTHTRKGGSIDIGEVRALIARHLNVETGRITDDAHFIRDLGADWLDRLELVILVEEIAGVEITDNEVDQIDVVGDLIGFIDDR